MQPNTSALQGLARWQTELAAAYTRIEDLLAALGLSPADCQLVPESHRDFPLRVPRGFVARMEPANPRDPLLLQILPTLAETINAPGFVADPVGDIAALRGPGLMQKYAGRALLLVTGACAINCRYCFRRSFPYGDQALSPAAEAHAMQLIRDDPGIREVILSGGDPLAITDRRLGRLLGGLATIPHVERVRLHSRVPVVLPERVDAGLMAVLRSVGRPLVIVIHANHPKELSPDVTAAFGRLRETGVTLLNQSVLLRGVNDSAGTLATLSTVLFGAGCLPYYLHQLDPVAGAAHFEVSDAVALEIMAGLRAQLPGYLVPRLVRELPGAPAKQPVAAGGTT